jgi:hypothetical protein
MISLLRSALLSALLATGLASITEVIEWDRVSPVTDISIIHDTGHLSIGQRDP